jgi:predicted AAA+ superfamily ATPase
LSKPENERFVDEIQQKKDLAYSINLLEKRIEGPGEEGEPREKVLGEQTQWTSADGIRFLPAGATYPALTPGYYDVSANPRVGIYFELLKLKQEDIVPMPGTALEAVHEEVKHFLKSEKRFKAFGLPFKRGFLMYGPQGSGKTTLIKELLNIFIEQGGLGLKFVEPQLFTEGMKILRRVQPLTPILVVMEDLDTLTKMIGESQLLNVLDGAEDISRVLFIATTNYPELLSPRLINRPSRFDKRFKIPHPDACGRRRYIESLIQRAPETELLTIDIEEWVSKTKDFSMAHLKELFVATQILGNGLDDAVKTLREMGKRLSSDHDGSMAGGGTMGFEKIVPVGAE